jgi:hypothetical protein
MTLELWREFLLWATVINYGILLVWVLLFVFCHDWTFRQHAKRFKLSVEHFDAMNYLAVSLYKLGIVLFNLVPFLALNIIG